MNKKKRVSSAAICQISDISNAETKKNNEGADNLMGEERNK
jgi:hypothetical protein